jgi:hypothetical protein
VGLGAVRADITARRWVTFLALGVRGVGVDGEADFGVGGKAHQLIDLLVAIDFE